ncbi:MAG TPA: hypothetical protein VG603_15675 [Chitinophagales bacterium]|nr:hypothetical protein [Chitinophagales bacterium]
MYRYLKPAFILLLFVTALCMAHNPDTANVPWYGSGYVDSMGRKQGWWEERVKDSTDHFGALRFNYGVGNYKDNRKTGYWMYSYYPPEDSSHKASWKEFTEYYWDDGAYMQMNLVRRDTVYVSADSALVKSVTWFDNGNVVHVNCEMQQNGCNCKMQFMNETLKTFSRRDFNREHAKILLGTYNRNFNQLRYVKTNEAALE